MTAFGRKLLLMLPANIGPVHKPVFRKSGLGQATIADYGAEGETELGILFQGGQVGS